MNSLETNHPFHAASGPPAIAHKFGGSSLADASCLRRVAGILDSAPERPQVVVVSAMQGVTNTLLSLGNAASEGQDWRTTWQALRERHLDAADELLDHGDNVLGAWLEKRFDELAELLNALAVLGGSGGHALELIQGLGEVYSAQMLAVYLQSLGRDYACLDARDVLVVRPAELGVAVDWDTSAAKLAQWRQQNRQRHLIVTGFVARTAEGRATTLGRNGSDFSGAIFAALSEASELHIWTDVDGVLSADPRVVPEAVSLPALSYHEACELAYFGAKVIHPQTMTPALARGLPIIIRNTFHPEFPGTRISADSDSPGPVKGLTLCPDLALLNVEGAGMIGVPGTAQRVFDALRRAAVSVVMISQGSSEHSICCVIRAADANRAVQALSEAFAHELARGEIGSIALTPGISVLAAVGDGMAGRPGVAARLFDALARARVNVRAIAQGASERNISVALSSSDASRALRAAHASFWLSPQTISIGLIGPGKVGTALLNQLRAAIARLRDEANLDLRVRALADSKRMWLDEFGNAPDDGNGRLAIASEACDLQRFAAHVHAEHLPHAVIIDCSANDAVADHYAGWLARGIHVITPNKHAGAGPLVRYHEIRAASAQAGARLRYEATVGAGLPVISTLRDLLDTGDDLLAIDGIFSGTLAWLFNRFDGSVPFSELVRQAHALGYTEPDPRDDLSGTDVARKLVILAREAGLPLSLADVEVESLVPEALRDADRDGFMAGLASLDAPMLQRLEAARARGCVLRYVARLQRDGKAVVALCELPADHAFAHLRLTDNCVSFTTRRYCDNPLVVQGPGAGPEVTAAGVFSDLLRLAAALGAKL